MFTPVLKLNGNFGTPVPEPLYDDALILHPEDLNNAPVLFLESVRSNGITVRSNQFVPRGQMIGMGKAANIMRAMKFSEEVLNAMRENLAFLQLLKRNNLSD